MPISCNSSCTLSWLPCFSDFRNTSTSSCCTILFSNKPIHSLAFSRGVWYACNQRNNYASCNDIFTLEVNAVQCGMFLPLYLLAGI